jgi:uncharacterized membrane protein
MKAKLLTWWERLHTSFWFVPGLVIGASVLLSAFTLHADRQIDEAVVNALPFVYHDGVEGARALLSAVAASMITVTGVVFSVTIVAFTLASSQFTPRLLRNFMRDVGNQACSESLSAPSLFVCACFASWAGPPAISYRGFQ